jgi:hypothetical protein
MFEDDEKELRTGSFNADAKLFFIFHAFDFVTGLPADV